MVGELNWLVEPATGEFRADIKLRAREAPHPATLWLEGDVLHVRPDTPAVAAPGQACVVYDHGRVLGAGFIRAARRVDSAAPAA
jgi:tRNA-specific 2-thiouridylase